MITAEINYGEEEIKITADLLARKLSKKTGMRVLNVVMVIIGIYELIIGLHNLFSMPDMTNFLCLFAAVAAFFFAFGGERVLSRRMGIQQLRKLNEKVGGYRKFTFAEDGCTIVSSVGSSTNTWDAFSTWGERSHYLWLEREDNQYLLVDLNKVSAEDASQLRSYCTEKIGAQTK